MTIALTVLATPAALTAWTAECLNRRDYESAARWLSVADLLVPTSPAILLHHARLERKTLNLAVVPQLLQQALQHGASPEAVRREYMLLEAQSGQLDQVASELSLLLRQEPQSDAAEICESWVNGALIQGRIEIARHVLQVWQEQFPDDPQPHYQTARLLEYEQQTDAAVHALEQALSRNSQHWPSRFCLARILMDRQRTSEAMSVLVPAEKMRCNTALLWQRTQCLQQEGKLESARTLLTQLLERSSADVDLSFRLVLEPRHGRPLEFALGKVEAGLGNHTQALHWLNIVLAADSHNLDARYLRGTTCQALNQIEQATLDLTTVSQARAALLEVDALVDAIRTAPKLPHAEKRCRIGELFLRYDDPRKAEFWLRETLNHTPNFAPAHRLLAEYYLLLADDDPLGLSRAAEHSRLADEFELQTKLRNADPEHTPL